MKLLAMPLLLLVAGCAAGPYTVQTPAVTAVEFPHLKNYTAIMLMPYNKVADNYITKLKGDDQVEFKGTRSAMVKAFSAKLQNVFREFKIVDKLADNTPYDVVIEPSLKVRYKAVPFRHRILVDLAFASKDSRGEQIHAITQYEGRLFGSDDGGEAFKLAVGKILDKTLDQHLSAIAEHLRKAPPRNVLEQAKQCQQKGGVWVHNACNVPTGR